MTIAKLLSVLLLPGALLLSGCDDAGGSDDASDRPIVTSEAGTGDREDGGNGEANFRLGDDTYDLSIRICDFSSETDDDMIQTLVARGEMDGEEMQIFASRNEVDSGTSSALVHTVSVQVGDIRSGDGRVIEAQRMRMEPVGWTSVRGGPAEPLIRIEGDRLVAEGLFGPDDSMEAADQVEGRLEATCP